MGKDNKKTMKNYGFQPPVIEESDFWLGSGKLGSQIINEKGDWTAYLPAMEWQNKGNETNCCVSFGTLSALEILHKFLYGVEPNYSDRFLCKISDTGPNGNDPKKVSNALRHCGSVPEEEYPFVIPLDEFFKEIPPEIVDMGKSWLKNFEVGYEYVAKDKLKEALKRSPVGCAVQAWNQNELGEYIRLGASNHWVVLVAFDEFDRPIIWDSYDKGIKILEKGYELDFPQIYTLKKKQDIEVQKFYEKEKNWFIGILKRLFKWT